MSSGCGCEEVYILISSIILLIPTPLVSALFCSIPTFCSFFFVLVSSFFNLCNTFFTQYKHTYGRLRASPEAI